LSIRDVSIYQPTTRSSVVVNLAFCSLEIVPHASCLIVCEDSRSHNATRHKPF